VRRKRGTHHDNVIANTNLLFQHDGNVDDLHAHVDNQLAVSTPLSDAGLTAQSTKATTPAPVDLCNPCMNGGVYVESEPDAECFYFWLVPAFKIKQGFISTKLDSLARVKSVGNFELSFTLLLNQAYFDYYELFEIMTIRDSISYDVRQPSVNMFNRGGKHWLKIFWILSVSSEPYPDGVFEIETEMVTGGTYDIKIRVNSPSYYGTDYGNMEVYIDGCLKPASTQGRVGEVMSTFVDIWSIGSWNPLDGELSNIKFFAIGDSCLVPGCFSDGCGSAGDHSVSDRSDNARCECLDGFSGATCQDATSPVSVEPCNPCMNGGVFVASEPNDV